MSYLERIEAARRAERAGLWQEALERYEEALRLLPGEAGARDGAQVLRWIGTVRRERGELELAEEAYGASLAVAEANELTAEMAAVRNCLAITAQYRGQGDEAERLYTMARELAERAGDLRLMAMVDQNLGTLASIRGRDAEALASYRGALERYRHLGDERSAAGALSNAGKVYERIGDAPRAEARFREAAEAAAQIGDATILAHIDLNRALLHIRQRRFEQARELCDRAFASTSRMGSKPGMAEAHKLYGMLYRGIGRGHLAEVNLSQALTLAQAVEDRLLEAETWTEWASLHADHGRTREALVALNRAHRLFLELRASRDVLQVERMFEELQPRFLRAVDAFGMQVAGPSDPAIGGHSRRVANFATLLGEAAGVSGNDALRLRTGALLHDVGKVVVPHGLLYKPGRLTSDEWEIIKSHTVAGAGVVSDLDFAWDIAPIARNHHEHWDGSGYPDRLRGEDIPLLARVVCVADVYDALTSERTYRPALTHTQAFAEMQAMSGTILDPGLLRTFRELADDGALERIGRNAELLVAA